jgi:hypothetical protein
MTRKHAGKVVSDQPHDSDPNPTGAARRRLFRALGKSGAAALGGLLVSRWQKPIVETVLLPAHAQTSRTEMTGPGSPIGCVVTLAVTLLPSGTFGYTAEVVARDTNGVTTTLNSSNFPSGSAVLSGATSLPPGSYDGIFAVTHGGSQPWSYTFEFSCCDTFSDLPSALASTVTSYGLGLHAILADDGTCAVTS